MSNRGGARTADGNGDAAFNFDQQQAQRRRDQKLLDLETQLSLASTNTQHDLKQLQQKYETELQNLRLAQIDQLEELLQERSDIESEILQSHNVLSDALSNMNSELKVVVAGRLQDCEEGADLNEE